MKRLKAGCDLKCSEQQRALRRYVHRYTGDHTPRWARAPRPNGEPYPVQFKDDEEWLRHTYFYVTKTGQLDRRYRHCISRPTWPENPELRRN